MGDIKTLVDAEVEKQLMARELEFAEAKRKEDEKLRSRAAAIQEKEAAMKKAEIASFCEGLQKEGKLIPAMMKHGMGMQNFLGAISMIDQPVEFSDGDTKKTQTPFEFMRSFLSGFKKQIEFGEFAGAGKDIPRGNDKRDVAIREYQEKNKGVNYKEAVLSVSREHPELFKE